MRALLEVSASLRDDLLGYSPPEPVAYVYAPLEYAWRPHERYVQRWGGGRKRVVFLGMNPGPFGMAQTGVPFGDVPSVRDFLGVSAVVERPARMHPARPIQGFACTRREVSGARLWGWVKERWGSPEAFFAEHWVANYCPLAFLDARGRNVTPDRLPREAREPLVERCDDALVRMVRAIGAEVVVGVGSFAERRAREALDVRVVGILHPSPASPTANRGWAAAVERQLAEQGLVTG